MQNCLTVTIVKFVRCYLLEVGSSFDWFVIAIPHNSCTEFVDVFECDLQCDSIAIKHRLIFQWLHNLWYCMRKTDEMSCVL